MTLRAGPCLYPLLRRGDAAAVPNASLGTNGFLGKRIHRLTN